MKARGDEIAMLRAENTRLTTALDAAVREREEARDELRLHLASLGWSVELVGASYIANGGRGVTKRDRFIFVAPPSGSRWERAVRYAEFARASHVEWLAFALAYPKDPRVKTAGYAEEHASDIAEYDNLLAWLRGIGCARCGHDHHTPADCDTFLRNDGSADDALCACNITDTVADGEAIPSTQEPLARSASKPSTSNASPVTPEGAVNTTAAPVEGAGG